MEAVTPSTPSPTRQKELGAFYTPAPMAEKLVRFAVRDSADRVFDPSFGGLVFLEAGRERLIELGATAEAAAQQLYGCDLDEHAHAAALAHERLGVKSEVLLHGDFFSLVPGIDIEPVDAVVGNPPYVRYQLAGRGGGLDRSLELAAAAGVKLTRLASSWAPFVLHATEFVAEGGRMALVLPAELMHAQYAGEVLSFVQSRFEKVTLAVFENRIFPGALEEVVLLFAEGRGEGTTPMLGLRDYRRLEDLDIEELALRALLADDQPETEIGASCSKGSFPRTRASSMTACGMHLVSGGSGLEGP